MPYDVRDFEKEVIEASHETPIVADFWAEWCAPCRTLSPILEKLAAESGGRWRLAKVDTEAFPEEAARHGVRGIPNVKLFVDGRPVNEFVGALPEPEVRSWLERSLPTEADREAREVLKEAREVVFQEPERALELLDSVTPPAEATEEAEDLALFARLLLKLDDPGTLEGSEAGRRYLEAIRHLRDQDFDHALGAFIEVLRRERSLDDEGPRRACTAIFRHLGSDHPVVQKRRGELAGALYV